MNMQSRESRNFDNQRLGRKESSVQDLNAPPHVANQNATNNVAFTGRGKLPPKSPNALTSTNSPNKNDKKGSPNKAIGGSVRH